MVFRHRNGSRLFRGHQSELSMAHDEVDHRGVHTTQEGKSLGVFICWLLGNGCLFGYNSMLTIEDYFVHLFPCYHPVRAITLTYQPFVLVVVLVFSYHEANVNTRVRNLVGYSLFFLGLVALIILDLATLGRGGITTFTGVCTIVAVFGVAEGHVEGAMTRDLCLMCPEFMQSFSVGMAASGAITSARLVTKAAFEKSRDNLRRGAMLFFATSCFFEMMCVVLYAHVFPKRPIVKFYHAKAASKGSLTVAADLAAASPQRHPKPSAKDDPAIPERLRNKHILMQNMDYALDMFLIYLLTLSVFLGFLAEELGSHILGSWYALVLIATYNGSDLVGRYVHLVEIIKVTSRRGRMATVLARYQLLPVFYCVARYRGEAWMVALASTLGLSNGYLIHALNVSENNLAATRLLTAGENNEKGKTELRAGSDVPEASKSSFYPFFMSTVVAGLVPPFSDFF
ncbi:equilibrative nucleotide transporter 3-like [Triticum dicoccoides]|uniref:equilibrative nucleotide transporter 3-like n=1 Tax=Triticum dicoccoides TaxID=85692 RepID=UPI001890442C|nr:equilibrative nucleotide transporter 3-like [Triticum dicoccoides]